MATSPNMELKFFVERRQKVVFLILQSMVFH